MIGCYIIYSKKLNKFYVGVTHDGLENRLLKHNEKTYGKRKFTASASDWEKFLFIECETFSEACFIERYVKKMKSSVYIENLGKYPELIQKLKRSYLST